VITWRKSLPRLDLPAHELLQRRVLLPLLDLLDHEHVRVVPQLEEVAGALGLAAGQVQFVEQVTVKL